MSIRQEKYAGVIQQQLADIFQHMRGSFHNAFITISSVEVSPDLGHAKVYLSLLNATNKAAILEQIELQSKEIRKRLAAKIRKQVRIIPEIHFFVDDSLDYVFHMEAVLKRVHEEDEQKKKDISTQTEEN